MKTMRDKLNGMSDEEFGKFLYNVAYSNGAAAWENPFYQKFCHGCPSTTVELDDHYFPIDLHECDFKDGVCPHGTDVVWWLQQPAVEEDNSDG